MKVEHREDIPASKISIDTVSHTQVSREESMNDDNNYGTTNYDGRVDYRHVRYPHCIVWTPIPVLTWLFPFVGHMGIARTDGVIRDFAGPYYVSVR